MYLIVCVIFSTVMWCIVNLNGSISSIRFGHLLRPGHLHVEAEELLRLREADAACDAATPWGGQQNGGENMVKSREHVGKCWKMLGTC
jgi:hypothetical protein